MDASREAASSSCRIALWSSIFEVEGAGADPAAVHWAENLDVPDRVEPEAPRYPCFDQFDDARHRGFGLLRLHEVESLSVPGGLRSGIDP